MDDLSMEIPFIEQLKKKKKKEEVKSHKECALTFNTTKPNIAINKAKKRQSSEFQRSKPHK